MLRVCIADDHRLIVDAVQTALRQAEDIEVVGTAHTGREALALVEEHRPDVMLLDGRMPDGDGLSCLQTIRERWPGVRVVMLSASEDAAEIGAALDAGASAYIGKRIGPSDLASALRQVASGVVYQSSPQRAEDESERSAAELTERERVMLHAVARGLSTKAISRELWVTERTVKFHLTNIYRKLGVHNRAQAMRYAYAHGLVPPPQALGETA